MRFPRCSGILLHPTSLPGPFGSGDLGASAYHFIDWLVAAGQSVWQMLPLGPVGLANSPYMSTSAFAGSPLLIDPYELSNIGLLTENDLAPGDNLPGDHVDYEMAMKRRMQALEKASRAFFESGNTELQERYKTFCGHESTWLDDYALFQSLDDMSGHVNWTSWDGGYVFRNPSALNKVKRELSVRIEHHKFLQWRFHEQWEFLKKYANAKGIRLIGDIPIFVAHHSADVWANQKYFFLGKDRRPDFVAGVPPDYFSETGQRWGNPLYKWDAMEKDRYGWWVERFRKAFRMFDIARIDHFRGFVSFWEIPASEEKAVNGTWKKGPGLDFFRSVQRRMGRMNIIAEDLGMITADVHELRRKLTYPGMKVLQFAFSGDPGNDYLPHNYEQNCVVYTGTHDNDTVKGWYEKITDREKYLVKRYCRNGEEEINWALIELAMRSSADIAVFPFQDVLGLGSEGRMNYPGKIKGNWEWRFRWEQVGPGPAEKLAELSDAYNRRNK